MADSLIPVSAVILAGGENRRMKIPKAFMKIGGISIIERQAAALTGKAAGTASAEGSAFEELIIISNDPAPFESLGLAALPDDPEFSRQRGPLTGVYTGLKAAKNNYILAVACDMPFISGRLARRLAELREGHDAVVPVIKEYPEPLFAIYSKSVLDHAAKALRGGRPRLQELFKELDVLYVGEDEARRYDPELLTFVNVNTPEELDRAERILCSAEG